MRTSRLVVTYAIIVTGCSMNAAANQWVTSLNAVQGGSCSFFGKGWVDFAFDGFSNIRFCKQITSNNPGIGVTDAKGFHPGQVNCTSEFGKSWENFAYDNIADMTFCMRKENVNNSKSYMADINVFRGNAMCEGQFTGTGWSRVMHNEYSNITFCAQFK